jgi:hypothetical protein
MITATIVTLADVETTPFCAMCQTFARKVTVFRPGKFTVGLLCKICSYNRKYAERTGRRHLVLCEPSSSRRWSTQ